MSIGLEPRSLAGTLPPGPAGTIEEQVAWFDQDPFGRLRELAREYGSMFTLRLGSYGSPQQTDVVHNEHWVFLTRPHQVKIMHEADHATVNAALANKVFFGVSDDGSLGYIDGKAHRLRRSQLQPTFSGRQDYASLVAEVVRAGVARWPRNEPFTLFSELQKLTSEVIVRIVCGGLPQADRESLCALLLRTENAALGPTAPFEAAAEIGHLLDDRIDGHLERCRASGRHDMLAALLNLAADGDQALTNTVIRDEVFALLYTGFSTTSNTLSWAFAQVLSDASVYKRLLEEIGTRFVDRALSRDDFSQLPYVEAIVKETLRLHPVSPLNGVRLVTKPLQLDGYLIPPGTFLAQCAYLLQRSPDLYTDAEEFRPERFLHTPVNPANWAPFGGGGRICIGRAFATEEMKMVLTLVFSTVRLELLGDIPSAERQGLFMAPADLVPVLCH